MAELAHFQNFAKLKDTKIEFNDITVLAGKPGTGKSYVMKYFYAVSEMFYQKQHNQLITFHTEEESILSGLQYYSQLGYYFEIAPLYDWLENKKYNEMYEYIGEAPYFYEDNNNVLLNILESILKKENIPINKKIEFYLNNLIKSIFTNHNQIANVYQVEYQDIAFNYQDDEFQVTLDEKKIFPKANEPIFVETPLILEFKKFMPKEKGKTPYHIESLLNILDTNYSFTDMEEEEFIKSFRKKSKIIIDGDIESSGDSFIFNRKDDKNYDILNASSGIKSIGLLQYLVTNKALKKGSVLFWEEPEVHLHPSWQLKMVDLFVELMNAGVKIVFSTHSPYMADYLNAISKRNSYRERISFNVLDEKDGVVTNHILDDDNWDILQKELMDTFEDILWQYL
jgi:predicted ATP-dependent endonuclease of OLD family